MSTLSAGAVIKSIIPLNEWNDYSLEQLRIVAADMPPDSTLVNSFPWSRSLESKLKFND